MTPTIVSVYSVDAGEVGGDATSSPPGERTLPPRSATWHLPTTKGVGGHRMIDCALPQRDSYGNRLRGLDRVGRRCSTDLGLDQSFAFYIACLWVPEALASLERNLDALERLPWA